MLPLVHDDFLARQLFPAHFLQRRQRMASRRHQHQFILEQADAFQRDGTGHFDAHAKIQLARMQGVQQAIVGHVRQDDLHFIAMLLAVARHDGRRHGHRRRDGADADAVPAAADGALDIGKGIARRIEQMGRVFQRQLAFARQVQLVGCAVHRVPADFPAA
jgi:hypothetical protein